jgi:hypothetical protein
MAGSNTAERVHCMKFSIRDLIWLTLLAAVAVAWWVDRRGLVEKAESRNLWLDFYDEIYSGPHGPLPPNRPRPARKLPSD